MITTEALLAEATALLDGETRGAAAVRPKAAAVLTRQALESSVRKRLARVDPQLAQASMRSQLDCLQVIASDTAAAASAWLAWSTLSRACHYHPYELAPNVAELRSLVATVEEVDFRLNGDNADAPCQRL